MAENIKPARVGESARASTGEAAWKGKPTEAEGAGATPILQAQPPHPR